MSVPSNSELAARGFSDAQSRRDNVVRLLRGRSRILATVCLVALAALASWSWFDPARREWLSWRPENGTWLWQVLAQIGSGLLIEWFLCLLLAFFVGGGLAAPQFRPTLSRLLVRWLAAASISFLIAATLTAVSEGPTLKAPSFPIVLWLGTACLWGSWLGASWVCGRSGFLWLVRQALLAAALLVGGGIVLTWAALSTQPLAIEPEPVSSEDRRRLVSLFREHDPRKLGPDETTELSLRQQDLNQLASWGMSLLPAGPRAEVGLQDSEISARATVSLPASLHLNLTTTGRVVTRRGELGFLPTAFQVGRLRIPATLLRLSGPIMIGPAWRDETTEHFFASLKDWKVVDGVVTISYGRIPRGEGITRDTLVGLGVLEDLEGSTRAQINRLIDLARERPRLTFGECFETAFDEASRRSEGGDAARENRAAILALGYLLGHSKLRPFLGSSVPTPPPDVRQRFRQVRLRDRRDWTRHFTLSAALQVLANSFASMDMGVLKEELDADGGSGFSFGDLLADRAGTKFAARATESQASARAIQQRIANGFVESDFVPDGSDLPEGLPDEEFQRQFGGVGGDAFNKLLAEIDRRIEQSAAYRGDR